MNYFRTLHQLVLLRTELTTINLSGSCCIRYRVFPVKTPAFILTVQWVANPLCNYTLYCVPYNCLIAYYDFRIISSIHNLLCAYFLGADLFQVLLLIISY
jgi:hypothetical protein